MGAGGRAGQVHLRFHKADKAIAFPFGTLRDGVGPLRRVALDLEAKFVLNQACKRNSPNPQVRNVLNCESFSPRMYYLQCQ